jgi:hypothetical protein
VEADGGGSEQREQRLGADNIAVEMPYRLRVVPNSKRRRNVAMPSRPGQRLRKHEAESNVKE